MSVVLPLLLAGVVALLSRYVYRFVLHMKEVVRGLWLTRGIPGPPAYPLIGSLPTAVWIWKDLHDAVHELLDKYGSTVRMWVGDRIVLIIMDPDDVEVVCTHKAFASKPQHYNMLNEHLGSALLTMTGGRDYKRHRKAITPSLHFHILQDFVPVFAKNAILLSEILEEKADAGKAFDSLPLFGMMTSKSVTETVLSTNLDTTSRELSDIAVTLDHAGKLMMWRVVRPWWQSDALFRISSKYSLFRETADAIHQVVFRILRKKSEEMAREESPPARRRMAFLDHMLRSPGGAALSRQELVDELKTFLFVGSSTLMDFMSFLAVALSLLPDVQHKVQQELDEVFGGDRTRCVEAADLPRLEYLERVLKEALRYGPPAPLFFRSVLEDVRLPSGHLVPRGCFAALVPAGTHRLPEHFPDPERFDPDRFLPEASRGRHPFAFVPFSAGGRNCIGQRYAVMFIKAAFASILRRVSFRRAPGMPDQLRGLRMAISLTMSIKGGARVRVVRREQHQQ